MWDENKQGRLDSLRIREARGILTEAERADLDALLAELDAEEAEAMPTTTLSIPAPGATNTREVTGTRRTHHTSLCSTRSATISRNTSSSARTGTSWAGRPRVSFSSS